MEEMGFFDRLSKLFNIIFSSPIFLGLLVIAILTIVLLIINSKVKNKTLRLVSAIVYAVITIYIFVAYGDSVLVLSDTLVDKVFNAIYFPNIITYGCMILISILLFVRALVDKDLNKMIKYISICAFCLILFLFVLVLDTSKSLGVSLADKTLVYTNETLLVLIQSSTIIFVIWGIILIVDLIVSTIMSKKIKKNINVVEVPQKVFSDTVDFDKTVEIQTISDKEFNKLLKNYTNKKKFGEYTELISKLEKENDD